MNGASVPCLRCGGNGCEYGCGRLGGCEDAYIGPDSHRICHRCKGRGVEPAPDGES